MSNPPPIYILDANVLIQAHRLYYAFPICPGFWDLLLKQHEAGRILSLDRIRMEITKDDDLHKWVHTAAPNSLFASTHDEEVHRRFTTLVNWVQRNVQYNQAAKDEFAQVADGWLVAYAQTHPNHIIVTQEERADAAKRRVPLPNLCIEFNVPYTDTFTMMKQMSERLVLASSGASRLKGKT